MYTSKNIIVSEPPTGIFPKLTTIISEKQNFSWSFLFPRTGEFGREQPDGSENGCVGDVSEYRLCFI